jgi:hypothetical protein
MLPSRIWTESWVGGSCLLLPGHVHSCPALEITSVGAMVGEDNTVLVLPILIKETCAAQVS